MTKRSSYMCKNKKTDTMSVFCFIDKNEEGGDIKSTSNYFLRYYLNKVNLC